MRFRARSWPASLHTFVVRYLVSGLVTILLGLLLIAFQNVLGMFIGCALVWSGASFLHDIYKRFRPYWTWTIDVDDTGVTEHGGLFHRDVVHVPWGDQKDWQRTSLRDGHFEYLLFAQADKAVRWQSDWFEQSDTLEAAISAKIGDPVKGK